MWLPLPFGVIKNTTLKDLNIMRKDQTKNAFKIKNTILIGDELVGLT